MSFFTGNLHITGYINILIEYIFNNNLKVDMSTFIVAISGQLALYGIILAVYQFVVSFQGDSRAVTKYLGQNLYIYSTKKAVIIDKILRKRWFAFCFSWKSYMYLL